MAKFKDLDRLLQGFVDGDKLRLYDPAARST